MKVLQRLIQVPGHLFIYNSHYDKNILVKENVFLCVDQIEMYQYIMNVIDQTGKKSFTRKQLESVKDISVMTTDQAVVWIGDNT